jgi:hypothetical protein
LDNILHKAKGTKSYQWLPSVGGLMDLTSVAHVLGMKGIVYIFTVVVVSWLQTLLYVGHIQLLTR